MNSKNNITTSNKNILVMAPSICLLIILICIPQLGETLYSPALPQIVKYFGTVNSLVESTYVTFFIGFALGVAVWGEIADRFGRRPCMLLGLSLFCLSNFFCMIAPDINYLLFFRFLQAIGISVCSVITQTIIRDCFSEEKRPIIFSISGLAAGLAPAFGPIIGGVLVYFFVWQSTFLLLLILGVCLFVATYIFLPETKLLSNQKILAKNKNYYKTLYQLITDRHVLACASLVGCFNGIMFSFYASSPFVFIELFNFTAFQYGLLGIFWSLSLCLGSSVSIFLNKSKKICIKKETIIVFSSKICIAAMLVYFFFSLANIVNIQDKLITTLLINIMIAIFYFSFGLAIPNVLSIALINYTHILGRAGSILGLMYYLILSAIIWGVTFIDSFSLVATSFYYLVVSMVSFFSSKYINTEMLPELAVNEVNLKRSIAVSKTTS